ncbi:hypothetical protein J4446_00225 [Candidatus Woesearchaeota archaeon]|nr:hypothetical protein [Candidatus Woesearchaeota archaeon]
MATFLDLSILRFLTPLFTFLFILIISYAVLDKFKLLGDHFAPKAIASFSIAMIFIFSTRMLAIVNTATPWFILMILFGFFIAAMLMFLGVKESAIEKTVGGGTVVWVVLIVSLILFIIIIVQAFQDVESPYGDEQPEKTRTTESLSALVHPRLLGALFLLIVSTFAVMFISQGFIKPS